MQASHPADTIIRRDRYPYAAPSPVENLMYWLVGSPIASSRALHERLTKIKALAVFSSDALSSVAYATEEILLVLVLVGSGAFGWAVPIGITIALLLFVVALSYNQTIHAYPKGGGSYIVASNNLGRLPGLIAGASLMIDYVLTVAVSISSGVAAVMSALPALENFRVPLAVFFVLLIAVANLRGLRESSTIFMLPTYAFIVSIYAMIGFSLFKFFVLHDTALAPTTNVLPTESLQALGLLLILRAFAAGCTALTGVEAISDGVPAFKPPEAHNASRTLTVMATVLISMFLGITLLTQLYPVVPQADHETVISQLGRTAFGNGPFYWFLQAATTLILVLAANTAYADFPRLSSFIARDGFLPRMFVRVGQRLVFTTGIFALTFFSIALIVAFGASTHNLIPLYAVGVFVSFTLSQAGMVRRWWKLRGANWQRSMIINASGAVSTAIVSVVIIESKLFEGAWAVVLLIPLLIAMFMLIHRHYESFKAQVKLDGARPVAQSNLVIVPVETLNEATQRALEFAHGLTGSVCAVHVRRRVDADDHLQAQWQSQFADVPLAIIGDTRQSLVRALMAYIAHEGDAHPADRVVVVVPERAPRNFLHLFLHNQTSLALKIRLFFQPNRIVVSVPYDAPFEHSHEHADTHRNLVIVPVARVDRATLRTLSFADTLTGEKVAVFVAFDAKEGSALLDEWRAAQLTMPLKLIESPYRSVTGPLIRYIDVVSRDNQDANVVVIMTEIVPKRRWQLALHNQTMAIFKFILLRRPQNRILISVPYHLSH
ncbi:MAG: APC family permease [Chloroflexota bacterium]